MKLPLTHIWQPAYETSQSLVVVLHGLGDSANGFTWLQEELGIDTLNFLLLNAPTPYYVGFSWYDLFPHQLPGIVESRKLLEGVFNETQQHGYPPEKTFLFGFSQGCLMTLEFGARHQHRLAGYVGISGYSIDPDALVRGLNPAVNRGGWLVTHGLYDELIPVEKVREQIKVLKEGGFSIDYREYAKSHTIDPQRELPEIREFIRRLI